MNAKDTEPLDYGDEDIDELESQTLSNRAAPIALAVASVVVIAVILAAWFFAIAPSRRDNARPAAERDRSESVVQQEEAVAAQPAEQGALPQSGESTQDSESGSEPVNAEKAAAMAGEDTGEKQAAMAAETGEASPGEAQPALPSFGTVRVESSGDAVLAGEAAPGANVKLFAGTEQIGETLADGGGNWALVLDKPLPAGTSDLWISAAKEGMDVTRSRQSVAIVIDPNRQARPLVVVQDDQGSRVLQQPEQEVAAARPAAEMAENSGGASGGSGMAETARSDDGAAARPAATGKTAVVIEAADYTESGELHISGNAAPNAAIRLYYDDAHAGDTLANDQGGWSLSLKRDLDGAIHSVRADDLDPDSGHVRTRAEVSFIAKLSPEQERELSSRVAARAEKEGESQVASAEPNAVGTDAATAAGQSAPAVATGTGKEEGEGAESSQMASASQGGEGPAESAADRGRITIERGDNLWTIAREHYGQGVRYTAIFQANKEQIRDPDLIFPGQVFLIPRLQDSN